MNVTASLHFDQQNQIHSVSNRQKARFAALGREEIQGLKASMRGSKALVLSEWPSPNQRHIWWLAQAPAPWIKVTLKQYRSHGSGKHQTERRVLTTSPRGRLHTSSKNSFQCYSGFDLNVPSVEGRPSVRHAFETSLCGTTRFSRWNAGLSSETAIRRNEFLRRITQSHLISRHRTSRTSFSHTVWRFVRDAAL